MARSTLSRNYGNVEVLHWLTDNEFVGTVQRTTQKFTETYACYGCSKGAGYFIYTIVDGHIEKIGTVPRMQLNASA
jgi:hypothetical protein